MKNIVVIGGGTMGNGIALTAAASGFDVTLVEVGQDLLDRAMSTISATSCASSKTGSAIRNTVPAPLLVKMVDAGWLGKKSGRGFPRAGGEGSERSG